MSTDQEHPGGICAWRLQAKRRGVVVKELPLDYIPGQFFLAGRVESGTL